MKIEDHLLQGDSIVQNPSPNKGGKFAEGLPDTLIIHFTAGPTAQSAINTLTDPAVQASAHVVIDYDGSITQLVPFDEIAWHAGVSSWGSRKGMNKFSIGIEFVNPGNLTKIGDEYQAWYGTKYPQDQVIKAVHRNETKPRYWHIFTPEQIEQGMALCKLLTKTYGIKFILGHEEISPGRKIDPGPAFPLNRLRDRVLNNNKDDNKEGLIPAEGTVTASKLNVRSQPSEEAEKVAKPLLGGTHVEIVDTKNGWYKVAVKITGWVSGRFIETEK